jgi:hypothetical protein
MGIQFINYKQRRTALGDIKKGNQHKEIHKLIC